MTMSRRDVLVAGGASLVWSGMVGGSRLWGQEATSVASSLVEAEVKPFRFVHMTDLHIQPEKDGVKGVIKALHALQELSPKPDFILMGGDLVFDSFKASKERSLELFKLYNKTMKDECALPYYNCIGNHDVYGWGHPDRANDPQYGKAMSCEMLGIEKTWYAFDHNGVRFYVLDSIETRDGDKYKGKIHGEQLDWLKADLASKPASQPAIVVTHIPIFTVTVFTQGTYKDGTYVLPNNLICEDTMMLSALLEQYNVKLALSGHIHLRDEIDMRGVKYINGGAVCGSWWNGPHHGIQEGFGIVDVGADGGVKYEYFDYGWEAV